MSRPSDWWVLDLDGDPRPGEILIRNESTVYRSVTNGSRLNGEFWSPDVPAGPLQVQLDNALLPEWQVTSLPDGGMVTNPQATHYVEATLPPGTTVYGGPAGPQAGTTMPYTTLNGGGYQLYIENVPADWLSPGVARAGS